MTDEMGTFYTKVGIENPLRRGTVMEVDHVLVDTGADGTWMPRQLLELLGVTPERTERYRMADGRVLEREIGFAIVHVVGITANDHIVFAEPGDSLILGARAMEGLNLRVDPREKRLVNAGPIITAVARAA